VISLGVGKLDIADRARGLSNQARHTLIALPADAAGQLTDVFAPTISFHGEFTAERYVVKM